MKSERINPMVIKELRQGLKSRSFVATFLGLQGAMVLSMFIYLSTASTGNGDLQFADGFFWFMLGLMLLVFMPLRAFQALYVEIKDQTLEMLFLTRMDAWRIAFGKWCALVVQIFLLVSAVLPYLVLRYFLGSIDIAGNLTQLFYQVIASMLFVALGVGLSAWTSKLMRGLIIAGALMSLYLVPLILFSMSMTGRRGPFGLYGAVDVLVGVIVSGILMMFFVEYGASQIAPPAENHSLRKRLLALCLTLVLGSYALFYKQSAEPLGLCMFLLIPLAIDALCEPLIGIPSVYKKMRKFRFFRWFFYPGWVSGFFFVTLLFFLQLLMTFFLEGDPEVWIFGLVAYNTMLMPFFFTLLLPVLARKPLLAYVSLQGVSLVFCLLMVFVEEIKFISDYILLGHFVPLLGFFVIESEGINDLTPLLLMVSTILMVSIILLKARRPLVQMQLLSKGGQEG